MPKNVFIASLPHSGSNLLTLVLGSHSKAVGFGEIYKSIARIRDIRRGCTCGKSVDECDIWGRIKRESDVFDDREYNNYYNRFLDIVRETYDQDTMVVECSKTQRTLSRLSDKNRSELKIIFLIKDVRSYVSSMRGRRRSHRHMEKDGWRKFYTTSIPYNIHRWNRGNRKIKQRLDQTGMKYFQLGYEELAFRPKEIINKLCDFLEIDFEEEMLIPRNSESHIVVGNRMRFDPEKLSGIYYDPSWFLSSRISLYGPSFNLVLKWNNENVYSNINDKIQI